MKYISEKIGDEYKKWNPGDVVFITSPTGTGKSTFIFKDLLNVYSKSGKRILYLVNRSILRDQLQYELSTTYVQYRESIDIMLYQDIENRILSLSGYATRDFPCFSTTHKVTQYWYHGITHNWLDTYDCIVCDECHYFLMDSNYNTNTILSFKFVNEHFRNKLRIYMSATIKDIKKYILECEKKAFYVCTDWLEIPSVTIKERTPLLRHVWEYDFHMKNDDIKIKIFSSRYELASIIAQSNKKWIVFVDSKEYGRSLKKDIEACFDQMDSTGTVNFVYSNYKSNADAWGEVYHITEKEQQDSKVLISTSVLDNGVNLKDINLRNIAIFADSETEFMQMLGRKRKDGMPINLYVMLYSKSHFEKRLRICLKRFEKIDFNYRNIKQQIQTDFDCIIQNDPYGENHPQINRDVYNDWEQNMLVQQNLFLLQDILSNYNTFEAVKATYLFYKGMLLPNTLSLRNLENFIAYYAEVVSDFDKKGAYSFLKRQLSWLGIVGEQADILICEELTSREEKSRKQIIKKFDELVDEFKGNYWTWSTIKARITEIKDEFKDDFLNILSKEDENYTTFYDIVRKNNAPCSKNFVAHLNQYCCIPFELKSENAKSGPFRFIRTDQE